MPLGVGNNRRQKEDVLSLEQRELLCVLNAVSLQFIARKVELKAMAPTHCSFSVSGNSLEYLIGISPEIMAYWYHRGINECYAGTSSESPQIKEEHELEEHAAFQLHKAVVRHSFRKIRLHRTLNEEQVVVLEIAECTSASKCLQNLSIIQNNSVFLESVAILNMFVTLCFSPIKVQNIYETTNFYEQNLIPNWGSMSICATCAKGSWRRRKSPR